MYSSRDRAASSPLLTGTVESSGWFTMCTESNASRRNHTGHRFALLAEFRHRERLRCSDGPRIHSCTQIEQIVCYNRSGMREIDMELQSKSVVSSFAGRDLIAANNPRQIPDCVGTHQAIICIQNSNLANLGIDTLHLQTDWSSNCYVSTIGKPYFKGQCSSRIIKGLTSPVEDRDLARNI